MPDKKRFLKNMAYASMVADGIDPIAAQQYLNGEYKEGIKTDTEASKRNAKAAAATLGVIGATAAAPAVFPVLMNPVTAKTAVGAGTATLLDAYGVTSGIKGLSGAFDKARYGSFKWRDVPELGLNLTTLIPGSSVLTTPKNIATAARTANNIYQKGKLAVNTAKEVKDLRIFVPKSMRNNYGLSKPRATDQLYLEDISAYDGGYTVTPEQGFTRRNQGGVERVEYMKKNPVEKLNATSYGETSMQEQIDLASRNFAEKYKDEFLPNFTKAIKYDALANGTLGYTEGNVIGPYVKQFGIQPGQIKFAHTHGDTSPLARLVEVHEAHHATGNMNDSFVLRHLIEKGLIDESKLTPYLKDADRGEVTAHLAELPDWLGFTGRINGKYTGHPFGKTNITSADIYNFNKWNHDNGFKHTIWDAINKDKMLEFVRFMNEHPFAIALPVSGLGVSTAFSKQKQGGNI